MRPPSYRCTLEVWGLLMTELNQLILDMRSDGICVSTNGLELKLRARDSERIGTYREQLITHRWAIIRYLAPSDICVRCRMSLSTRWPAYWGVTYCCVCFKDVAAELGHSGQWPPIDVPDTIKELKS